MKETEQTLLDQIKDQVGRLHYGEPCVPGNQNRFNELDPAIQLELWPIVCELYAEAKAKASCEATLKKASEKAMVHYKGNLMCDPSDSSVLYHPDGSEFSINKQSIIDPSNIVIL